MISLKKKKMIPVRENSEVVIKFTKIICTFCVQIRRFRGYPKSSEIGPLDHVNIETHGDVEEIPKFCKTAGSAGQQKWWRTARLVVSQYIDEL
jgi:hypothetical protein